MYNQTLTDPGVYEERKYNFGREVIFFNHKFAIESSYIEFNIFFK